MTGLIALLGRTMLCAIFLLSAVGNKIPKFEEVVGAMEKVGVPNARVALQGAIAFLILGSISVILGMKARLGAFLLLVFLAAATYYFHAFWKEEPGSQAYEMQMIQFMKNLALAGAMVFIIGNGAGPGSVDNRKPVNASF
jgi:putative oxidoreductase